VIRRDLELLECLDRLGFEEAWIGEHHSAGYEVVSSPELFIAAAAERTRRIKLRSGVVSCSHNPLVAANRRSTTVGWIPRCCGSSAKCTSPRAAIGPAPTPVSASWNG
jgi:hypothetical protein